MMVLIVEKAPRSLRGELSRWLLEPKPGIFVGRVSAMVRDRLWKKVCNRLKDGFGIIIWKTNNEQGFAMDFWGVSNRYISDWEGLQLVTILKNNDKN